MTSAVNFNFTSGLLGLVFFCVIIEAAREICFKYVADKVSFRHILLELMTWVGIGLWIIELLTWTYVLEHLPLSVAFPLMSLTYVAIVVASTLFFKEQINRRHAMGAMLITAGVAFIGASGI